MSPLMKHAVFLAMLAATLGIAHEAAADTLRVASHNALNFRGQADSNRLEDFRIVMSSIQPDVVCMQEIISEEAVDLLLSFAFLPFEDDWAAAPFLNGPDTDNAMFFRTSKIALVSQRQIPTTLRDISEYVIRPAAGDTTLRLRLYSAHLKAGDGDEDQARRLQECTTFRQQVNMLEPGSLFMMMGDFNLYTSAEDCYQLLLSPEPLPNGQLFDPINRPGEWHNTVSFADIHTQSPRTQSFGGGATGGMDDRFDFILVSAGLMDTSGSYVIPETYKAYGNDGQHFNMAINDGFNAAVPDSVADALHYAADHLPVVVDVVMRSEPAAVSERPGPPSSTALISCYPNPFNGVITIELMPSREPVELAIYDLMGRVVYAQTFASMGTTGLRMPVDFGSLSGGTYWVSARTREAHSVQRITYIP